MKTQGEEMWRRSTNGRQQAILAVLFDDGHRTSAAEDCLPRRTHWLTLCRSAFLPGVAEEDLRLPCSVRVPAGLGVERPFTIWDLGGVDRDPALRLRLLRAICGPEGPGPVYVSSLRV